MEMIDCIRRYQINGEVCTLKWATLTLGIGAASGVIAGVAGKRHRIMGWIIQGTTATQPNVAFRTTSGGGTVICAPLTFPASTNPPDKLPINDSGYFECDTSGDLRADVTLAAVSLFISYITYTPVA